MEQLLTLKQAATRCGVCVRQVYKLRSSGQFPEFVRLGRSVRVRESQLDTYIRNGCKVSQ